MGIVFTVNDICIMGKYYANLELMSCQVLFYQPLHTSRSEEKLEIIVQNTTICALLVRLAQPPSAFTLRCETDKAGWGALEPPLEDDARTKRFDQEIPVPRIPYWGQDEKNSWPIPVLSKTRIITYIDKGSAWVPAYAGTHASGRAGQHFELFDSILGRVTEITTHNDSLRVQYVR